MNRVLKRMMMMVMMTTKVRMMTMTIMMTKSDCSAQYLNLLFLPHPRCRCRGLLKFNFLVPRETSYIVTGNASSFQQ